MCFGNKSKTAEPGPRPASNTGYSQNTTASYPKPTVQHQSQSQSTTHKASNHNNYAPPSGPPPSFQQSQSQQKQAPESFAPPPGPPPGHISATAPFDYAPPAGPPPSSSRQPEEWELAVPDTSLFPPPPAFFDGNDRSWTTNADEEQARAGEDWCAEHPLMPTLATPEHVLAVRKAHTYTLRTPAAVANSQAAYGSRAHTSQAMNTATGVWNLRTQHNERDTTWVAMPPAYSVQQDDNASNHAPVTLYYEVRVNSLSAAGEASVAIGYTALPYPDWRMPGWHRGSLAVHGDDGHRYINDRWGGVDFTQPFQRGDTVGLGMRFERIQGVAGFPKVTCFFTRNGVLDGQWDLNEEEDANVNISKVGLQGSHDLCYAVGAYQEVDVDVIFDPSKWLFSLSSLVL